MNLDIDALRLTEDEVDAFQHVAAPRRMCADAQLAKALWGYADYLETLWQGPDPQWEIRGLWLALLVDLEQANIARPTAGKAG